MDVIGVNRGSIGKRQTTRSRKAAADIKVVYISSPMKVRTSASKFRALVQKLTGQDSDAERFMELIHAAAAANTHDQHRQPSSAFLDHYLLDNDDHGDRDHHLVANTLATSSYQSSVAPPDDLLVHNFDASFSGMFQDLLHGSSSQFDEMPGLSALL